MNDTGHLKDLGAFLAVCQHLNFTRAAAALGVTQSALSQTVRALEDRLGVRLFARTTRSVSLTPAGEQLMNTIAPHMAAIEDGLSQITELQGRTGGTIRLSADEFAIQYVLWPALAPFLRQYPDIRVELTTDYGRSDIVQSRYDAGVRRGRLVAKDMVAVRISADTRMAVVGAPNYFANRGQPKLPPDLVQHTGINLRLATHGELFTWTFKKKGGKTQRLHCEGPLVFSSLPPLLAATLDGFGLAWLPEPMIKTEVEAGRLVEVLGDWAQTFEAYHLYYPHRRHPTSAFSLLVAALRV